MSLSVKIVMVGDRSIGKTSLQITYESGVFPKEYIPTVFSSYVPTINIDNQTIGVQIWDTQGNSDYDHLRPLSYPQTDIFLLCFSLVSHKSFLNIKEKWIIEVNHHCPNTPCILVGLKRDLRENYDTNNINSEMTDAHKDQIPISTIEGEKMREEINAEKYIECSSLENFNVREVFELAVRTHLNNQNNSKKSISKCTIS